LTTGVGRFSPAAAISGSAATGCSVLDIASSLSSHRLDGGRRLTQVAQGARGAQLA